MFGALLRRLRGDTDGPDMAPLYTAIVAEARQPHWYQDGGVEDSVNGRFEMVSAMLAIVLIRLEALGEPGQLPSVRLTELFVDDMDGQLREAGVGDVVVGKHIGRLMSALGGRISAYRAAFADQSADDVICRNLHRGAEMGDAAVAHCWSAIQRLASEADHRNLDALIAGKAFSA